MTRRSSNLSMTTRAAAQRLGCSLRSIQIWCNQGLLKHEFTPGGHRRFREEWVEEFLNRNNPDVVDESVTIRAVNILHRVLKVTDSVQCHTLMYVKGDEVLSKITPQYVRRNEGVIEISTTLRVGKMKAVITLSNVKFQENPLPFQTPSLDHLNIAVHYTPIVTKKA